MPMVIPVVAGAWGMVTAGAALAAGATIASGLAMVGSFFTLVGGLAGDKDALKMGSLLGAAGGIAGGFSKTAGAGSTTNAAGEAAAQTAEATAGNTVADAVGNQTADVGAQLSAETMVNSGEGLIADAAQSASGSGAGQGLIPGASGSGIAGEAAGGLAEGLVGPPSELAGMGGDATKSALFNTGYGDRMSGSATEIFDKGVGSSFGDVGKAFGGVNQWLKDNPELAKIGGGIIKGATDYMGQRQQVKDRLDAEKSYRDWVRQRYSDSVRNLQIPTIAGPAMPGAGIIAGQRG